MGRLALAFYCLGSLDLLGLLKEKTNETDRETWRKWIWEQQTRSFSFHLTRMNQLIVAPQEENMAQASSQAHT
jgi:hypothetical protein